MNFFEYNNMGCQSGYGRGNGGDNGCNQNNAYGQNVNGDTGNFQDKFESYKDKSESELMGELSQVVQRMKAEGTFDIGALENFYNTATPFLNEMQRERMKSIIDMLRQQ